MRKNKEGVIHRTDAVPLGYPAADAGAAAFHTAYRDLSDTVEFL